MNYKLLQDERHRRSIAWKSIELKERGVPEIVVTFFSYKYSKKTIPISWPNKPSNSAPKRLSPVATGIGKNPGRLGSATAL
jgi:hypothetical protein